MLNVGFTKLGNFHLLLNPVPVVWNAGKVTWFPWTNVVTKSINMTGNSNESMLIPLPVSQRTSWVTLRKRKWPFFELQKDLYITLQIPYSSALPNTVRNPAFWSSETLRFTLRRTSGSFPFSVRPHPAKIKSEFKILEKPVEVGPSLSGSGWVVIG